ncbi:MAG: cytidylate kinase-like family protein [Thermodesulfobacteriota bacterium]|nr:cytidylate kinase-like family protein [Thermodesulfobacteriota bacterium]
MVSKHKARIEAQLSHQLYMRTQEQWMMRKGAKELPFITISREYGCHGYEVSEILQDKLNRITDKEYPWGIFDKEVVRKIAEEHQLSEELANSLGENQRSLMQQYMDHIFFKRPNEYKIFQYLTQALIGLAEKGHAILIGRGGCIITKNVKAGFHVRLIAPFEFRVEKIRREMEISKDEAEKHVKEMEKQREAFIERYTLKSIHDPKNFHIIFNNSLYSPNEIADTIIYSLKLKGYV